MRPSFCLLKQAERGAVSSLYQVHEPQMQYPMEVWNVASAREVYIDLPKGLVPDNLGFRSTESTTPRSIRSSSHHASTVASRGSYRRHYYSVYSLPRATFTRSSRWYTSSRVLRVCLSCSSSSGLRRAGHLERCPPLLGELLIRLFLRHLVEVLGDAEQGGLSVDQPFRFPGGRVVACGRH
jgi:hypothetical protein